MKSSNEWVSKARGQVNTEEEVCVVFLADGFFVYRSINIYWKWNLIWQTVWSKDACFPSFGQIWSGLSTMIKAIFFNGGSYHPTILFAKDDEDVFDSFRSMRNAEGSDMMETVVGRELALTCTDSFVRNRMADEVIWYVVDSVCGNSNWEIGSSQEMDEIHFSNH